MNWKSTIKNDLKDIASDIRITEKASGLCHVSGKTIENRYFSSAHLTEAAKTFPRLVALQIREKIGPKAAEEEFREL